MMRRRTFLAAGAAALASRGAGAAAPPVNVKFGLDLYSLRSQGWTPIGCRT
ncbi:MAG: hypothetical protein ABSG79_27545 [Bryobacteraceae bacterium]|jgi:hypothetical protein